MKILLTNDDSHRSPLLQLAADTFERLGTVDLVVPLHEQSWTGKSISRFTPVHVQHVELCGRPGTSVSGTPADCVNVGIHNLLPSKPDLVVSGINAGFNIGVGFILSSGTVGACLEANIAGVPAIAISQAFDSDTRNAYTSEYMIAPATLERFVTQAASVLDLVLGRLLSDDFRTLVLQTPVTWNINLPFRLQDPAAVSYAPIGATRYAKSFHESPNSNPGQSRVFRHESIQEVRDTDPRCDSSLIARGIATVSLIDIWSLTERPTPEPILALAKSFSWSGPSAP